MSTENNNKAIEETFEDYIRNARNSFADVVVKHFPHMETEQGIIAPEGIELRTACEDILIAYDQMRERLFPPIEEQPGEKDKEKMIAELDKLIVLASNQLAEKEKEITELKAWKESAISVMPPMQEIGKALGVKLGESIHDKILPGIERLKGLLEYYFTKATWVEGEYRRQQNWQQFKNENNL